MTLSNMTLRLRPETVGVIRFDRREIEADVNLVHCWGANDKVHIYSRL